MPPWVDICSKLNWEIHRLDDGYFSYKNYGRSGVYRLIGLVSADETKKPVTFNRLCGQDTTGTLYIGRAGRLHERLNQMRVRRPTHEAISALRQIPCLDFPRGKLAVAIRFTGHISHVVEANLIGAYVNSFGDAPPLNYRLY